MNTKFTTIDLFAGCGGLTEGFKKTGKYDLLAAVEWEKYPSLTLKKRLSEKWEYKNVEEVVLQYDIQKTEDLLNGWEDDPDYNSHKGLISTVGDRKVDVIVGGPPCQAYSIAGRIRDAQGMQHDYRNYLFESYIEVVNHFKPSAFLFENVPGILSAKPGGVSVLDRIREGFSAIGYTVTDDIRRQAVFDTSMYSVPQVRKRVIIVGLNESVFGNSTKELIHNFYTNILPSYRSEDKKTVKDSLIDLPRFTILDEEQRVDGKLYSHKPFSTDVLNHVPRYHNKRDINIFRELAEDAERENPAYCSVESLKKLYTEKTGKTSSVHKYNVLNWDQPSNTIVAHLYKDGLRHIHPDPAQARGITVREAARLQTFDDDFEFLGGQGSQYMMIGNAVPPVFSKHLGNALYKLLTV